MLLKTAKNRTVAYSGWQRRTRGDRGLQLQWHTGDVHSGWPGIKGCTVADRECTGIPGKAQGMTGRDRGYSYGQGFSEPEVFVPIINP